MVASQTYSYRILSELRICSQRRNQEKVHAVYIQIKSETLITTFSRPSYPSIRVNTHSSFFKVNPSGYLSVSYVIVSFYAKQDQLYPVNGRQGTKSFRVSTLEFQSLKYRKSSHILKSNVCEII